MNYIGIDTSLTSTGVFIKTNNDEFYYNYKNNNKLSKWHKTLHFITYNDYHIPKLANYNDEQIAKIIMYDNITDKIVKDILTHCDPRETIIFTEGYAYSSNAGPLIDLVTYATLLRLKLLKYNFIDFKIIPPSSLKINTCKKVYKPIEKIVGGKNARIEYIYKNNIGIPGGSFKKNEMLGSLFDCKIDNKIKQTLLPFKVELLQMKNIPAPISDIVDAIWLVYSNI